MPIIEVENLHKRYGETVAVADVSFTVDQGEIFGVLGPNGAGKTTTVECVAGLHVPDAGTVRVLGYDPRRDRVRDERQRMAREIHDTLAQGLTGIITQLQAAQQVWRTPDRAGGDPARPHVNQALALARDSLAAARRSVQALRPAELDRAQLPEALRGMAGRWSEGTGVDLRVDITGEQVPLSAGLEVVPFRVAQEALTNISRHAGASRVGVTLSYLGDVVLLDVRDDGVGIPATSAGGFGIDSMTQRVRSVGGTLEIESGAGEGTAVSVSVPALPAVPAGRAVSAGPA